MEGGGQHCTSSLFQLKIIWHSVKKRTGDIKKTRYTIATRNLHIIMVYYMYT